MQTIFPLLGALLALLSGISTVPADAVAKEPWKSVIYADGDSVKVNGYLLQQVGEPRQFSFVSLWRYDVQQKKWLRVVAFPLEQSVTLTPGKREAYSRKTDQVLVQLPDQLGLYWAEWKEDDRRADTLAFSGPVVCNDVAIGDPPEGMIAACVPFPGHAKAMFVPDPKIHCRK